MFQYFQTGNNNGNPSQNYLWQKSFYAVNLDAFVIFKSLNAFN